MSDLSLVERRGGGVVVFEEEHVDEGNEETGSVLGHARVVPEPLVEDQNGEVAKQTGHEDDLRDESPVDIQRLLEIPGEPQKERAVCITKERREL